MDYQIQKIILKDSTIYNVLLREHLLGHIVETNDDKKYMIQVHPSVNFSLIAEELGFDGTYSFMTESAEQPETVKLLRSENSMTADFKVFNFDYLPLN